MQYISHFFWYCIRILSRLQVHFYSRAFSETIAVTHKTTTSCLQFIISQMRYSKRKIRHSLRWKKHPASFIHSWYVVTHEELVDLAKWKKTASFSISFSLSRSCVVIDVQKTFCKRTTETRKNTLVIIIFPTLFWNFKENGERKKDVENIDHHLFSPSFVVFSSRSCSLIFFLFSWNVKRRFLKRNKFSLPSHRVGRIWLLFLPFYS